MLIKLHLMVRYNRPLPVENNETSRGCALIYRANEPGCHAL